MQGTGSWFGFWRGRVFHHDPTLHHRCTCDDHLELLRHNDRPCNHHDHQRLDHLGRVRHHCEFSNDDSRCDDHLQLLCGDRFIDLDSNGGSGRDLGTTRRDRCQRVSHQIGLADLIRREQLGPYRINGSSVSDRGVESHCSRRSVDAPVSAPLNALTSVSVERLIATVVHVGSGRRPESSSAPSPPRYIDMLLPDFEVDAAARWNHLGHWDNPSDAELGTRLDAQRRMNDILVELADVRNGSRVLDVGSGFGGTLQAIDEHFTQMLLVGLEIDQRQLRHCKPLTGSRTNRLRWVQGDGCHLPLRSGTFDHVLAIESMWHLASRRAFFHESARVLRPGGRLAAVDILVNDGAASRRGMTPDELCRTLNSAFAPWPEIEASLPDLLLMAEAAGLRRREVIDATDCTKPSYLDHVDATPRPGAAAFSSDPGVELFVELHRRNEIRIIYMSFERLAERHGS